MTTKHTPGPWFHGCEDDPNSGDVYAADSSLVAEVFVNGERESRAANANLIAAAPDLLEACKQAERWLESWASEPYLDTIRAAIAKATGSQS